MTEDAINTIVSGAAEFIERNETSLKICNLADFLALDLPPREYIVYPILAKAESAMVFAPRGIGKTWFALSLACAVAAGETFLRWQIKNPMRVLYIDGEMQGITFQERAKAILKGMECEFPSGDFFKLITPDLQTRQMPDIATDEGRNNLDPFLQNVDLVIVDNIACLVRSGKSNEEEAWRPIQAWVLELRRRGISIVFVHHAGKGGDQRGSSAREDCLDITLKLSRPENYKSSEGARFEVGITKGRNITGTDAESFEAALEYNDGRAVWKTTNAENSKLERMIELADQGLSQRAIAKELGVSLPKVNRSLKGRIKEF